MPVGARRVFFWSGVGRQAPNNVFTNIFPLPLSRHVSQQQSMEYTSNLRHVQHTTEFGEKERYWPLGYQVSFVLL